MSNEKSTEWHERRRQGIGGSDVAAILGVSPWKTALDVYLDKIGEAPPIEETEAMYWGNVLEDVVAQEFARRMDVRVERRNTMFRHRKYPELLGNIDRYIVGTGAILECKTTSGFNRDQWGEQGTDEIPMHYLCQVQHYMNVLDKKAAWVAVLIDGRDFRVYCIDRNNELCDIMTDKCVTFWRDYVLTGTPPPASNRHDVELLYAAGGYEGTATAEPDTEQAAMELARLKAAEKQTKKQMEELETKLKQNIGDASALVSMSGETLATWKSTTSKRLDTKALRAAEPEIATKYEKETTSRRFLLKIKTETQEN